MNDHAMRFRAGAEALEGGDADTAQRIFHGILAEDPRAHPAWNALSVVAQRTGSLESAVDYAQKAVELDRRNCEYLNTLGAAYMEAGRVSDAEKVLRRALKLKPVYPSGLYNLGKVLEKQECFAESRSAYERALAMGGSFPDLYEALAQNYRRHGEVDRAISLLRTALNGPSEGDLAPVMAECIAETRGIDPAIQELRGALARHPENGKIQARLALMLLSTGQWREGWTRYTWRYISGELDLSGAALPPNLEGKRIRLVGEQGLGDVLFFLRYMPALAARGAAVDLTCEAKLATLLRGDGRFVHVDVPDHGDRSFDYRVSLGDLPALLRSDDVAPAFSLTADSARRQGVAQRLRSLGPPPYLGLTWRAGPDLWRSKASALFAKNVPIDSLGASVRGWPGTVLALQRKPVPEELATIQAAIQAPVHDLSALNDDLPGMLALLDALDEYVGVSNTNVHLLAGLSRRARVLIPYPPEWRWMRTEGRSAWFPDFPVYREPPTRGWSLPLALLRADLFA